MAINPFTKHDGDVLKPNRNAFDLSFSCHGTFPFGALVPVMCQPVVPGDTIVVEEAAFGINAMPMQFPIQNRISAMLYFFYVRNRNLWDKWEDYIGKTLDNGKYPHPYIGNFTHYGTGEIFDYLGLPTTVPHGYVGSPIKLDIVLNDGNGNFVSNYSINAGDGNSYLSMPFGQVIPFETPNADTILSYKENGEITVNWSNYPSYLSVPTGTDAAVIGYETIMRRIAQEQPWIDIYMNQNNGGDYFAQMPLFSDWIQPRNGDSTLQQNSCFVTSPIDLDSIAAWQLSGSFSLVNAETIIDTTNYTYPLHLGLIMYDAANSTVFRNIDQNHRIRNSRIVFMSSYGSYIGEDNSFQIPQDLLSFLQRVRQTHWQDTADLAQRNRRQRYEFRLIILSELQDVSGTTRIFGGNNMSPQEPFYMQTVNSGYRELVNAPLEQTPFDPANATGDRVYINALPFRAYESIFNSFFRNEIVNPYVLNGEVEYNKFCDNDSGADMNEYQLHYRNYEKDFLTSAVPSPQQGVAPLVGITPLGEVTLTDENGITTEVGLVTAEDESGHIVQITQTSPLASNVERRAVAALTTGGFTINDFRNVNALQRFLERNIRRGYRYKDQILSHFGVEPRYQKYDLPEFLGGVKQDMDIREILNNSDSDGGILGRQAGVGSIMGRVGHKIEKYCDEHGYIMAILSITPIPAYSSTLPKFLISPNDSLDYYSPEFKKIGFMPITYAEVDPIVNHIERVRGEETPSMFGTFGYQHAWYDFQRNYDQVHGFMRTNLKDYLFQRSFYNTPMLSPEFITIDPSTLTDPFTYRNSPHVFLGQVAFKMTGVRPFAANSMPEL